MAISTKGSNILAVCPFQIDDTQPFLPLSIRFTAPLHFPIFISLPDPEHPILFKNFYPVVSVSYQKYVNLEIERDLNIK